MNLFRIHRKSKHKIKFKTVFLFIFSLIMTTFAWFAYSRVLNPTLNFHIASWDMEYSIEGREQSNEIAIQISDLYPTMPQRTVTIDIKNNGERTAEIDYRVDSVAIADREYDIIYEGQEIPAGTDEYIIMAPSVVESTSVVEDGITIVTKTVKGAIIKDIERFPFTVDLEHSYEVEPDGGTGYLRVDVNWIGDDNILDSEWGYIVGETSVMSLGLTIDAYQQDEKFPTDRTVTMPSTATTNPYLPTGFTRVAGTTLETGLTIKDGSGNEYVWIEVPKTTTVYPNAGLGITSFSDTEYQTIESDLQLYTSEYRSETAQDSKYGTIKKEMLKSIYKNGGFYIGKYETGTFDGPRTETTGASQTAVIQQHAFPYNWVTREQANNLASNMPSGNHKSSLMFGLQWDLVLKYLEINGVNIESNEWGNFYNTLWTITNQSVKYYENEQWKNGAYGEKTELEAILLSAGASSTFSRQSVYDLSGNIKEWTLEASTQDDLAYVVRGGNYTRENTATVSSRSICSEDDKNISTGFRVTIY